LTPEQAARLAAMLPRPRYFDRHRDSAFLGEQAARIQARMHASQIP
jgi:monofunctional biosynthetic peptidoglycan transglycosylase